MRHFPLLPHRVVLMMWANRQVLLLNPAPLIGLSATVGAPERFSAWLASIEKTRGREYSLIQHHHRFVASVLPSASH